MVGQWTMVTKPSRSDEVPDEEERLKNASQVRAQFDSLAPRRPLKPNRSEPDWSSSSPVDSSGSFEHAIPELDKLRSLQSQPPQVTMNPRACFRFVFSPFPPCLRLLISDRDSRAVRYIIRACSQRDRVRRTCRTSSWRPSITKSWSRSTNSITR